MYRAKLVEGSPGHFSEGRGSNYFERSFGDGKQKCIRRAWMPSKCRPVNSSLEITFAHSNRSKLCFNTSLQATGRRHTSITCKWRHGRLSVFSKTSPGRKKLCKSVWRPNFFSLSSSNIRKLLSINWCRIVLLLPKGIVKNLLEDRTTPHAIINLKFEKISRDQFTTSFLMHR